MRVDYEGAGSFGGLNATVPPAQLLPGVSAPGRGGGRGGAGGRGGPRGAPPPNSGPNPASNVPQSALAVEELVQEAGFPDGLLATLLISGADTERLIDDAAHRGRHADRLRARWGHGSRRSPRRQDQEAGSRARRVGPVRHPGRCGPRATPPATAARARNQNNGQSCIAAKRFIVEDAVADEFGERGFADAVRALRVGDPASRDTNVGPLARADLRDTLARQVDESRRMGAEPLLGGEGLDGRGYFYAPTILDGVDGRGMPAFREETFGPVAALLRARDVEHAIELANDTVYGLGAAVWTRDLGRREGGLRGASRPDRSS